MAELQPNPPLLPPPPDSRAEPSSPPPPAAPPVSSDDPPPPPPSPPPPPRFDPSRMIGIIRRKALIKDLAAVYHTECLAYCQELLELQRKWEEPKMEIKTAEIPRKGTMRPPKRLKKTR